VRLSSSGHKKKNWEYEVRNRLEQHGWKVLRIASPKPVNLIAVKPGVVPLAIECKVGRRPSPSACIGAKLWWSFRGFRYLVVVKRYSKRNRSLGG